ncbi:MAG: HAD-IA family hydrolase [Isosphaeraceae bacterium]
MTNFELKWSGVVFDAVGTTIEANPTVAEAYARAAKAQGTILDVAVLRERFRRAYELEEEKDRRDGTLKTDEANERRRWRDLVATVMPEVPDGDRAFEELWRHFGRGDSWQTFPDLAEALELVKRAGIPTALASNFDSRLRSVVADLPELANGIELVISSEVGFRKPHEDFYRVACDRLDLPPEGVLFIGDDLENDVLGPRRIGASACWLNRRAGAAKTAEFAHFDLVSAVRTLWEVPS